jgi:lipopolysaccharide export system permease protein
VIFEHSARREFARSASGIFVALFAILISIQLIRLLNEAAGGRLAPEAVAALLGFAALNYLPVLLSLTLFMAVLLPLSRAYRDSEMIVWFASGLPLAAWLKPVARFAFPIILAVAALSLFLSPWAVSQSANYRNHLEADSNSVPISPGAFREVSHGNRQTRVIFVDKLDEAAIIFNNVFVSAMQDGRLGVIMANSGTQEVAENGDRFLMLEHGRRYEVEPGTPEFRVMEFERYGVRVKEARVPELEETPRSRPLWKLSPQSATRDAGELLWRAGQPIAALLLAFLAVPLSFVNPRASHSFNILFALVVFTLYNNLISISQAWVARGILAGLPGFVLPHLVMVAILAFLFYQRLAMFLPARRLWRALVKYRLSGSARRTT